MTSFSFYKKKFKVFVFSSKIMIHSKSESIMLYDQEGKTVSSVYIPTMFMTVIVVTSNHYYLTIASLAADT